uniref:MFS transporter n=1 Tax=Priestia megaterium TaxID=1404 RepID=UPI0012B97C7B
ASNMLMEKFGGRVWISRIVISWGIMCMGTGFGESGNEVYIIRLFVGVGEGGLFRGVIVYVSYWFGGKERGSRIGMFMRGMGVCYIIGGGVCSVIMDHIDWMNIGGWGWMFIIEGGGGV